MERVFVIVDMQFSMTEIVFDGNVEELSFVGYFVKSGRVVAAVSLGKDPIVSAVAELLNTGNLPTIQEIQQGDIHLLKP